MAQKTNLIKLFLMIVVSISLMTGCAMLKDYGTLKAEKGEMTVDQLSENWKEYNVYYAGLSVENPSALIFGTRIDGRRITYDNWVPVKQKSVVEVLVKWLNANIDYPPQLSRISGPKGAFFGYMYSYWNSVEIKGIDHKTIWVGDLMMPPIDYGPGTINPGTK